MNTTQGSDERHELLVTAGIGPVEVRWFVRDLSALLCRELPVCSVAVTGIEDEPYSVLIEVDTPREHLFRWLGAHTLLRRSTLRGRRSRRRWYANVSLLPPIVDAPPLDPGDVEIQTTRAGGPGGQHVNRTDSAVIVSHRPSGVSVRVQDQRSQHQNRKRALERLADVLHRRGEEEREAQVRQRWLLHHRVRGHSGARPVRQWEERDGQLVEVAS